MPFRVAILRVDFLTDRGGPLTSTPDGRFDLRSGVSAAVDPPPHNKPYFESHGEALARYYRAQTNGRLEIEVTVFPAASDSAYHLTDLMDYGPWVVAADNVDVAREAERFITDALTVAHASGEFDPAGFDGFIVVHAGADLQSDINRDSPRDIPTFVLEFGDSLEIGGTRIGRTMVLPETTSQDGLVGALNGVLAHEFGHILGLFDLYNVRSGFPMVGYWSLMDSGENIPAILVDPTDDSEVEVVGALPASLDAWSRLFLYARGYCDLVIQEAGPFLNTTLAASELGGDLVFVEIHDSEYYLIENRSVDLDGNGFPIIRQDRATGVILGPEADSTIASTDGALEYDALLPGSGLLVWHIDDAVLAGPLSGVFSPVADPLGVNTRISRRGIRLVEADAIDDLGRRNNGTPWDPYYVGNNNVLGPFTTPGSLSNERQQTLVTIETPSVPGPAMAVRVTRNMALAGWPVGLAENVTVEHPTTLDVTGDGSPEVLFTFGRNIVALEGKGAVPFPLPPPDAPPGTAVPFLRHTSDLSPRLAAEPEFLTGAPGGRDPLLAGHARVQGRIVTWNARTGTALSGYDFAATAPAIGRAQSGTPILAFGDFNGGAHFVLPHPTEPTLFEAVHFIVPPGGTTPAAAAGNVIVGGLADGGAFAAWPTLSGSVRIGLADAAVLAAPAATPLRRDVHAETGSIGAAPLTLLAAPFRIGAPGARSGLDIVAVDPAGIVTLLDLDGVVAAGWPVTLAAPMVGFPGAGDVDGDGAAEVVVADTLGTLNVLNGDGSRAFGFPLDLKSRPLTGPLLVDVDGEGGAEILIATEDGSLHAIGRKGRNVPGFPLALGGRRGTGSLLVDLNGDGRLDVVSGSDRRALLASSIGASIPDSLVVWRGEDGGPGRNAVLGGVRAPSSPLPADRAGVVCFPNPARGDHLNVRFQLEAGQGALADVFDLAGRPVAVGLAPRGNSPGEQEIRWNLNGVAPGVYMVKIDFTGTGAGGPVWRTVSVLR